MLKQNWLHLSFDTAMISTSSIWVIFCFVCVICNAHPHSSSSSVEEHKPEANSKTGDLDLENFWTGLSEHSDNFQTSDLDVWIEKSGEKIQHENLEAQVAVEGTEKVNFPEQDAILSSFVNEPVSSDSSLSGYSQTSVNIDPNSLSPTVQQIPAVNAQNLPQGAIANNGIVYVPYNQAQQQIGAAGVNYQALVQSALAKYPYQLGLQSPVTTVPRLPYSVTASSAFTPFPSNFEDISSPDLIEAANQPPAQIALPEGIEIPEGHEVSHVFQLKNIPQGIPIESITKNTQLLEQLRQHAASLPASGSTRTLIEVFRASDLPAHLKNTPQGAQLVSEITAATPVNPFENTEPQDYSTPTSSEILDYLNSENSNSAPGVFSPPPLITAGDIAYTPLSEVDDAGLTAPKLAEPKREGRLRRNRPNVKYIGWDGPRNRPLRTGAARWGPQPTSSDAAKPLREKLFDRPDRPIRADRSDRLTLKERIIAALERHETFREKLISAGRELLQLPNRRDTAAPLAN